MLILFIVGAVFLFLVLLSAAITDVKAPTFAAALPEVQPLAKPYETLIDRLFVEDGYKNGQVQYKLRK